MYQMYRRSGGNAALRAQSISLGDNRLIRVKHIPAKMSSLMFWVVELSRSLSSRQVVGSNCNST
jgi:hypothetical protein